MSLQTIGMSAFAGPGYVAVAARVEAEAGDADAAIAKLQQLMHMPAGWYASIPLLRLDPAWDPIRDDPRFAALLKNAPEPDARKSEAGR